MFHIFNTENVCIGTCSAEPNLDDLRSRGEYALELTEPCAVGDSLVDGAVTRKATPPRDIGADARLLRNNLRSKIDTYLMPAATIHDAQVTDEQKQTLIADSLLLAAWPTTVGWPLVPLPELSPLLHSLITVPNWSYQ